MNEWQIHPWWMRGEPVVCIFVVLALCRSVLKKKRKTSIKLLQWKWVNCLWFEKDWGCIYLLLFASPRISIYQISVVMSYQPDISFRVRLTYSPNFGSNRVSTVSYYYITSCFLSLVLLLSIFLPEPSWCIYSSEMKIKGLLWYRNTTAQIQMGFWHIRRNHSVICRIKWKKNTSILFCVIKILACSFLRLNLEADPPPRKKWIPNISNKAEMEKIFTHSLSFSSSRETVILSHNSWTMSLTHSRTLLWKLWAKPWSILGSRQRKRVIW